MTRDHKLSYQLEKPQRARLTTRTRSRATTAFSLPSFAIAQDGARVNEGATLIGRTRAGIETALARRSAPAMSNATLLLYSLSANSLKFVQPDRVLEERERERERERENSFEPRRDHVRDTKELG